jgi:NADH:ubiquinone oxidoreductase subunit H
MKSDRETFEFKPLLLECAIYSVLVVAYFLLVLHFLGGWLKDLYDHHRWPYAFVALALMLGQAVVLEMVTSLLLRFTRSRSVP